MSPQAEEKKLEVTLLPSASDSLTSGISLKGLESRTVDIATDHQEASLETLKRPAAIVASSTRDIFDRLIKKYGQDTPVIENSQKATGTIKSARRGQQILKKTLRKSSQAAAKQAATARATVKTTKTLTSKLTALVVANPEAALIGLLIILIVVLFSSSSSNLPIPLISLKSHEKEINKTYTFITQLDVEIQEQIASFETSSKYKHIDTFNYFVNGATTSEKECLAAAVTNVDLFLTYLDSKYDDYTLDGFLIFYGTKVRNEVKKLHKKLYTLATTENIEIVTVTDGQHTWEEEKHVLNIQLSAINLDDYLADNQGVLTEEEHEKFDAICQIGAYTTLQELASPFPGWENLVSSRYGWRIHPITDVKDNHQGLDIALPEGTPINATMSGTATVGESESLGKYVKITLGDKSTLYAHCSKISVRTGQNVSRGDVIGLAGSTGTCTGSHLHIEYIKNGISFNPAFYLARSE